MTTVLLKIRHLTTEEGPVTELLYRWGDQHYCTRRPYFMSTDEILAETRAFERRRGEDFTSS